MSPKKAQGNDISKGRYWDNGVTAVQGCTKCSPGCDGCWSIPLTRRFQHENKIAEGKNWTGLIRTRPDFVRRFNTREPKVFAIWNDFFHESVPDSFRNFAYAMMIRFYWNTYLILTKRSGGVCQAAIDIFSNRENAAHQLSEGVWDFDDLPYDLERLECDVFNLIEGSALMSDSGKMAWPPNNIWHGLTVCNQQEADEKIPIFLQVPGKKFLSIEPMLGEIDLTYLPGEKIASFGQSRHVLNALEKIDAVILGGETGSGARPMHPEWVRTIYNQCAVARIPFFFKQWGEWFPLSLYESSYPGPNSSVFTRFGNLIRGTFYGEEFIRVGKKKAGRVLYGMTHDDLPWRGDGLK